MATEITPEQQPAFEKMKTEGGFKNSDGSFFNVSTGEYSDGKSSSQLSPEDAFEFRKEGYTPLKEAQVVAAAAVKDVGKVETKTTTGESVTGLRTIVELDALKSKLGTKMSPLGDALAVNGNPFSGSLDLDKDFNLNTVKAVVTPALANIFSSKADVVINLYNSNLSDGELPLAPQDAIKLLTDIYTEAALKSVRSSFKATYPNYVAFKNSLSAGKSYKFTYDISVDKNSVFTSTIKPDADPANQFLPEYTAYDKINPKPVELTPSEVKLNERAKNFKNSGVGRFLGAMGVINVGEAVEGETKEQAEARETKAYAEALNGSNFIAQFFIYFMGGSAMLADGGASIKDTLSGLDPKFQAVVKGIEAKVPKMMAKMAEDPKYRTPEDELEAAKTEPVKAEDFAKILSGEKAQPEKTIKLSDKYDAGETGLTITLKDGAEMIIPEGTSIRIKDKSEPKRAEDKKPRSFTSTITVTGELPVGTKFNSKVVFEKPGDKAATAKKEAEKPAPDTNEKPAS